MNAAPTGESAVDSEGVDRSALALGGRIRAFRQARGLTLVEVADKTGLTHSFISQLERGLTRPSMGSLDRIAKAVGSSQLELLAAAQDIENGVSHSDPEFVVAGGGVTKAYAGTEAHMLLYGDAPFHVMEFVYVDRVWGDFFSHAEAEFIRILEGRALIEVEGRPVYSLGPGDSLYYPGSAPHRWNASDESGFRILLVKQRADIDSHADDNGLDR